MEMKPFNLKEAIDGATIVTRSGIEVTDWKFFRDAIPEDRLFANINGNVHRYEESGRHIDENFNRGVNNPLDLMLNAETKRINGIECPLPLTKIPSMGEHYYVVDFSVWALYREEHWAGSKEQALEYNRGLVFDNPLDAIITAMAMLGLELEYKGE